MSNPSDDYDISNRIGWAAARMAIFGLRQTRAREGHIFQLLMTVPVCSAMQGIDDLNEQNTHDSSMDEP